MRKRVRRLSVPLDPGGIRGLGGRYFQSGQLGPRRPIRLLTGGRRSALVQGDSDFPPADLDMRIATKAAISWSATSRL